MEILKELADPEILYLICVFVAIIVLLIVIYLITNSGNRGRSSYIGADPTKPKDKTHRLSGGGKGKVSNNQTFSSDLFVGENNVIPSDKSENTKSSNSGLIKDSNENLSRIHQSSNVDGTVRTEIDFDSSSEGGASKPFLQKYEYLETANNGQFRKLLPTDEKSFFRTWVENGIRLFEFYGNVDKALANINAIFDDVCEIEGKQNGATQIINVEPGILSNQLKVEKMAKIKLI